MGKKASSYDPLLSQVCLLSALAIFAFLLVNLAPDWVDHCRLYFWGETADATIEARPGGQGCSVKYSIPSEDGPSTQSWYPRHDKDCKQPKSSFGHVVVTYLPGGAVRYIGDTGKALKWDALTLLMTTIFTVAAFYGGRFYIRGVLRFFSRFIGGS